MKWFLFGYLVSAFFLLTCWADLPTLAPWEARDRWRTMGYVLGVSFLLLLWKAWAWHQELTWLIRLHR